MKAETSTWKFFSFRIEIIFEREYKWFLLGDEILIFDSKSKFYYQIMLYS